MERKRRVTQRDVADRANVSTAVVSYVINDGPRPTSPEVRERVLRAVAELGYHPNAVARGLRAGRTHTIGFVANDYSPLETFGSHYLASILSAMTGELKARDHYLLIYPMAIGEELAPLARLLRSDRLDGVVVRLVHDPPATDELLALIAETHVPCVCIERPAAERFGFPSVTYDDAAGAAAATRYLIERGHRRIAHLHGDLRYATAQARRDGYRRALVAAGLPVDPALDRATEWSAAQAAVAMRALLRLPAPPTAVFAASDDLGLGALEAARAAGCRVPDDVAVIGFDDIPLAREITPSLTTVRIPLAEIGRRAARLVVGDPDRVGEGLVDVLPIELIPRGSA